MPDKRARLKRAGIIYILYLLSLLLLFVLTRARGLVLRHYLVRGNEPLVLGGLFYLLIARRRQLPTGSGAGRKVCTLLLVLLVCAVCLGLFCQLLFFETDRETVTWEEGKKQIKVERSFLLFYEVSYYDYGGPLWYRAYPCVRESYDDGDPDQLVYIDRYDENGTLVERRFIE